MIRFLSFTVLSVLLVGCGSSKLVDKDLQPAELTKIEAKIQLNEHKKLQLGCDHLGYLPQMKPVYDKGQIFVACGLEVTILDAVTLNTVQRMTLANEASSGVVKVGNDLYVGSLNGYLYRLNAQDLTIQNKF